MGELASMNSQDDLKNSLQLQLSEFEMMQSMFPTSGELEIDDPTTLENIQGFLDDTIEYDVLTQRLGFVLKLPTEKETLELVCQLPHEYPSALPEFYLRCASLSRPQHRRLTDDVTNFIEDQERGDLCLAPITQWLQDNVESYIIASAIDLNSNSAETDHKKPIQYDTVFSRLWIYSHHIYSKIKRKAMLDYSSELNLTGFCMPGKPGIVCIEGYRCHAEEFWQRIRRMQWKRIILKEQEETEVGQLNVDDLRKFGKFEEQYFEPRQGKGRGAHCDRGLLFQFLEKQGCGHIFQSYFGVEGKIAMDSDSD